MFASKTQANTVGKVASSAALLFVYEIYECGLRFLDSRPHHGQDFSPYLMLAASAWLGLFVCMVVWMDAVKMASS